MLQVGVGLSLKELKLFNAVFSLKLGLLGLAFVLAGNPLLSASESPSGPCSIYFEHELNSQDARQLNKLLTRLEKYLPRLHEQVQKALEPKPDQAKQDAVARSRDRPIKDLHDRLIDALDVLIEEISPQNSVIGLPRYLSEREVSSIISYHELDRLDIQISSQTVHGIRNNDILIFAEQLKKLIEKREGLTAEQSRRFHEILSRRKKSERCCGTRCPSGCPSNFLLRSLKQREDQ